MSGDEFQPSELGTKSHWDQTYRSELENFKANGDVGEIWFGEESVDGVINWLKNSTDINQLSDILDAGCGNGMTLIYLTDEGYKNLYGVDYSEHSIELAIAVAEKKGAKIQYEVGNISVPSEQVQLFKRKYKVILDKGTYDAISLNPENALNDRKGYIKNIELLLDNDGYFIITSCNWTAKELVEQFKDFTVFNQIPTAAFQFGGQTGHAYTSMVFMKTK